MDISNKKTLDEDVSELKNRFENWSGFSLEVVSFEQVQEEIEDKLRIIMNDASMEARRLDELSKKIFGVKLSK